MLLVHTIRHANERSLRGILEEKKIKTSYTIQHLSPDLPYRMDLSSASFITEGYTATLHPAGIIFETDQEPVSWCPVDMGNIRINDRFPEGYEQFHFKRLEDLLGVFPNAQCAGEAVARWREAHESNYVHKKQYRLIPTEAVFSEDINISPVAAFGFGDLEPGIPMYRTHLDYFFPQPSIGQEILRIIASIVPSMRK